MNKKIMTWSTYEAPKVQTLDVLSEGVLCGSFTDCSIDDATEDDWGTL